MNSKAFTLIELLVVISIIGLLASIVLASLEGGEQRAITGKAMSFSHTVRVSLGSDLVGEWKFEEGSGITAKDSSGSDNHGTLVNSPQWVAGIFGKALEFNGSTNYVRVPDSQDLRIENEITLEAWVNSKDLDRSSYIINKRHSSSTLAWRSYTIGCGSNKFRFYISDASQTYTLYTNNTYNGNEWHHIVGTWDGNNMRIYVNASEDGLMPKTGSIPYDTNYLYIGGFDSTPEFIGTIDEVRIYDHALDMAEIQQLYAEGAVEHSLVLK
ncbi:MAG: LamG-like jellyroll fold domain-containing protein [bacterium]